MRVYCGDLNIHIGELIDFLLNDDLDRYKECVELVDNPIILTVFVNSGKTFYRTNDWKV
jgi:hypothetical protein